MRYFIMLSLSNGNPIPMVDGEDYPYVFDTEEEAKAAAAEHPLAQKYHFEIYPWNG